MEVMFPVLELDGLLTPPGFPGGVFALKILSGETHL
jgi:hypothetical protein